MKYWELVANKLSKAGWSLGWVSAVDSEGRTIWIVDAQSRIQPQQKIWMKGRNGRAPRYDVTQLAHYNVKDNHCYVELTAQDTGIEKGKQEELVREVYDGQTGDLLASCSTKNPPLGKRFGTVLKLERVPASALPTSLHFTKEHEEDCANNQAERTDAYIDYLMEGN